METGYFVHDGRLLLERHGDRVLVAVAVQADLVARVCDHPALFGEGLERVAWDEPGRFDVVPLEHGQQAAYADRACEEAWISVSVSAERKRLVVLMEEVDTA